MLAGLTSHRAERYSGEPLRISLLLHRRDGRAWSDDELWPFASHAIHRDGMGWSDCVVDFTLRDGRTVRVDYAGTEGTLSV